jgi:16S rRNA (guanine(966)-N(2))-methyltransferase RsmD
MDKMRESVFACLGDITGLSFLDIFSGSGIIALEAASRGADPVDAVEQDKLKRKTLIDNVSIAPRRINCHFMPAELFVKRGMNAFDIIFLDPPFHYKFKWQIIADIAASPLASNESRILIHRPHEDNQKEDIHGLKKEDTRRYGRSVVDFFIVKK